MQVNQATEKRAKCELASISFFDYCKITDSEDFYDEEDAIYLEEICNELEDFENNDYEAIIVTEPPRHRKNKNSWK